MKIVLITGGAGTIGRLTHLALKEDNVEIDYFCDSGRNTHKGG